MSNNDTMIDELEEVLPNFPGVTNRTWCFLHIVNLIAKQLLKQFDVPRKNADAVLDEVERELWELVEGLDMEELVTQEEWEGEDNEDNDNTKGWINKMDILTVEDCEEL
jgi:hypothetical protein